MGSRRWALVGGGCGDPYVQECDAMECDGDVEVSRMCGVVAAWLMRM